MSKKVISMFDCEFCLDDADHEPEFIGVGIDQDKTVCHYLMHDDEPIFKIKYCPMCGRKLVEG